MDVTIMDKEFKILNKLHYRLSCKTEILYMGMMENLDIELELDEDGEPMDFKPTSFKELKGLDFGKKQEVMDLLLTEAVKFPVIKVADLDNEDHELNPYFKDLADFLMDKYMVQFMEEKVEKKKLPK